MKKVLGSLALFGILATGGMVYADDYEDCMNLWNSGEYKEAIKAGKLATKKHPKDLGGYECLARVYHDSGKLDLAYETMKKAEKIAHSKKDLMNVYREIADILKDMGKLDDAIVYYNKSLNLARDLKDSLKQFLILKDIADVYARKGDLDKALSYYNEALNLEAFGSDKADIYNSIADIYDKKGDHQKSIEYRQKAIDYIQQATKKGYLDEFDEKIGIGNTYKRMKDYKTAEKYILEALNRAKKNEDKEGEANAYIALGDLYKDMGDKKRAKEYYQHAYKALEALKGSGLGNDKFIQVSNEADEVLKKIKQLDKSN
ncbi:MAG: tetratricopeptide repeat protein [Sulfurihydrogenibium sp.]|jgi:tetratricopeptide (TPR) repeat protein|nr:tetratricopeptide repeat protein [Sulfurihydrogenibium sp.]